MLNDVGYPDQAMMPEAFPQAASGKALVTNPTIGRIFSRKRRESSSS
jgi:hypothetical protein